MAASAPSLTFDTAEPTPPKQEVESKSSEARPEPVSEGGINQSLRPLSPASGQRSTGMGDVNMAESGQEEAEAKDKGDEVPDGEINVDAVVVDQEPLIVQPSEGMAKAGRDENAVGDVLGQQEVEIENLSGELGTTDRGESSISPIGGQQELAVPKGSGETTEKVEGVATVLATIDEHLESSKGPADVATPSTVRSTVVAVAGQQEVEGRKLEVTLPVPASVPKITGTVAGPQELVVRKVSGEFIITSRGEGTLPEEQGLTIIQIRAPPNPDTPICQVDDCTAELGVHKEYYRRHRVCEMHAKATSASYNGQQQRFCQQCSRFHVLEEFDEGKRSCRRRLLGHNKRRRKQGQLAAAEAAAAAAAAAMPPHGAMGSAYGPIPLGARPGEELYDSALAGVSAEAYAAAKRMRPGLTPWDVRAQLDAGLPPGAAPYHLAARPVSMNMPMSLPPVPTFRERPNISPAELALLLPHRSAFPLSAGAPGGGIPANIDATTLLRQAAQLQAAAAQSLAQQSASELSRNLTQNVFLGLLGSSGHVAGGEPPAGGASAAEVAVKEEDAKKTSAPGSGTSPTGLALSLGTPAPISAPDSSQPPPQTMLSLAQGAVSSAQGGGTVKEGEAAPPAAGEGMQAAAAAGGEGGGGVGNEQGGASGPGPGQEQQQQQQQQEAAAAAAASAATAAGDGGAAAGGGNGGAATHPPPSPAPAAAAAAPPNAAPSAAAEQTARVSFKLFDRSPEDLPADLRDQVMEWLAQQPSHMESYMRPGCILLTLHARMPPAAWRQLKEDLAGSVERLVSGAGRPFWSRGTVLVQLDCQLVVVCDGAVGNAVQLPAGALPRIAGVRPLCITAGQATRVCVNGHCLLPQPGSLTQAVCLYKGAYSHHPIHAQPLRLPQLLPLALPRTFPQPWREGPALPGCCALPGDDAGASDGAGDRAEDGDKDRDRVEEGAGDGAGAVAGAGAGVGASKSGAKLAELGLVSANLAGGPLLQPLLHLLVPPQKEPRSQAADPQGRLRAPRGSQGCSQACDSDWDGAPAGGGAPAMQDAWIEVGGAGGVGVHESYGRVFIEVEVTGEGKGSNAWPLLVADADVCQEVCALEEELDSESWAFRASQASEVSPPGSGPAGSGQPWAESPLVQVLHDLGWSFQELEALRACGSTEQGQVAAVGGTLGGPGGAAPFAVPAACGIAAKAANRELTDGRQLAGLLAFAAAREWRATERALLELALLRRQRQAGQAGLACGALATAVAAVPAAAAATAAASAAAATTAAAADGSAHLSKKQKVTATMAGTPASRSGPMLADTRGLLGASCSWQAAAASGLRLSARGFAS
eukprot:jgi/Mesen1/4776/ME000242S03947